MDFLGRLFLVIRRVSFTVDYLYHMHVFFSDDVLWRNYLINRVELFEEKSILVVPECSEASGVESVWGEVSQESRKNRNLAR